jgi:cytochrome o ubiquinol oxidase subunit 1
VRPYVAPTGAAAWITTGDHKRIGRLYAGFALLFGLATAAVGALLSLERVDESSKVVLQADSIAQLFSLYRYALIYLVGLPLLLGVAIAVVPLQVGARGISFPRAAAMSFWMWLVGGGLMIGAYAANGGPGGGDSQAVSLFLVSLIMVLVALVTAGVCLTTTVLTGRAPGMKLEQVPAFAWAAMVTGVGLVVSLPVVIGNLVMITIDHRYGQTLFGGNAVGKYIDIAVRQPQIYLYAVPLLGIVADIVATASRVRQAMRGPLFAAIGLSVVLGIGVDMQASVNPDVRNQFLFIFASVAFVLPVVMVLGWVALALKNGKTKATGALVLGMFSLLLLAAAALLGALTGFERLGLVGSTYETGHLNLVIGAGILAGLAGLAHWWPKLSGRLVADALVKLLALPAAGAVVLMGVMEIVMGLADKVPADTVKDTGSSMAQAAGVVGFVGQLLLLVVLLGFAGLLLKASRNGEAAGDDPWDGQTLEWATPSPAPADNFASLPVVTSAEPLLDLKNAGKDA